MLEALNIHKVYNHTATKLQVLKGINLKVQDGDILSIVGPSGAGKSTLLHILGGLDKPSEGSIIFDGQDIYGLSEQQRANIRNQRMGFVFQFYHLLPEFTVLENVILPACVKAKTSSHRRFKEKGLELLKKVGLAGRTQHKPHQLSGGEQQRTAIARALVNDPKIVFCDEPTGNLDSQSGREIVDLMLSLNKANNQTFVIVTHDEYLARLSPRTAHIRDGKFLDGR